MGLDRGSVLRAPRRFTGQLGPVLIVNNSGSCLVDGCDKAFLAADGDSAETMAKRHWKMAHPEW
jgi:hypothetical protein